MEQSSIKLTFPVSITGPSGIVRLGSVLRRGVLAVLSITPGKFVSSETLTQALWDDAPPTSSRPNLRKQFSDLRKDFRQAGWPASEALETVPSQRGGGGGGARLAIPPQTVDVLALEHAAHKAKLCLQSDLWEIRDLAAEVCGGRLDAQFSVDLPSTRWFTARREWVTRLQWNLRALSCVSPLLSHDLQGAAATLGALEGGPAPTDWLWIAYQFLAGDTVAALDRITNSIADCHSRGLDSPDVIQGLQTAILNADKGSVRQVLLRYSMETL